MQKDVTTSTQTGKLVNALAKGFRVFRRDLMKKDPQDTEGTGFRMNALGFGVLAAGAGIIAAVAGAPTALAGIASLYLGVIVPWGVCAYALERGKHTIARKFNLGNGDEPSTGKTSGMAPSSGMMLWGPKSAVNVLLNTQLLVDEMTQKYSFESVPAKTLKRLEPYLQDAADAAKEVNAYSHDFGAFNQIATSRPRQTVDFLRTVFNTAGKTAREVVASVEVPVETVKKSYGMTLISGTSARKPKPALVL